MSLLKEYCKKRYRIPTPIQEVSQEITAVINEVEARPKQAKELGVLITGRNRPQERMLIARALARQNAFTQQLIKDGRRSIRGIGDFFKRNVKRQRMTVNQVIDGVLNNINEGQNRIRHQINTNIERANKIEKIPIVIREEIWR